MNSPIADGGANHLLATTRLSVIGVGRIGEAVLRGLFEKGIMRPEQVRGSVRREASLTRVRDRLGIEVGLDNAAAARGADVVLLAVKPQGMPGVLEELAGALSPTTLIISVVASVETATIEEALGGRPSVIRTMPNTPCMVGAGMSVLCPGSFSSEPELTMTRALFDACGETTVVREELMDAVTGLSGSGPAYIYLVIESLAEAGVKVGIPRDVSTLLSAQTVLGAARMVIDQKAHPALLKDSVTTPAGCTVDGLLELEEGKLRVTLIKAVVKAAERAAALSPARPG
jgi:pyrroline-5-carboxylate reductase